MVHWIRCLLSINHNSDIATYGIECLPLLVHRPGPDVAPCALVTCDTRRLCKQGRFIAGRCCGAGHAYYFLEDVYPRMTGRRPLRTPRIVKAMFPGDAESVPVPAAAVLLRPAAPPAAGAVAPEPAARAVAPEPAAGAAAVVPDPAVA